MVLITLLPSHHFFANDYKSGTLYLPAGDGKVSWTDVRDIGPVNTEVLLNPEQYTNQKFIIAGSDILSYAEAIAVMNEVLGKKVKYVSVSDDTAISSIRD